MLSCPTARVFTSTILIIAFGLSGFSPYQVSSEESSAEGEIGGDGHTHLNLDYVFTSATSDIELNFPGRKIPTEAEIEAFIEEIDHNPVYATDRIEAPRMAHSESGIASLDFVGDEEGLSGFGIDVPIWEGAYSDTLLNTQSEASSSGSHAGYRSQRSTSFETGYIPEYDETPRLVDEGPVPNGYLDAQEYSRLPAEWAVPPNAGSYPNAGSGYGSDRFQRRNQYYSSYNDPRYAYPDSRYQSVGYHHPEGPYAYNYGIQDPFWTEGRGNLNKDAGFTVQSGWPILNRGFNPDEAHLKVGPIYLKVVSAEAGVLYSDYDGPQVFAPGQEDGWLSFVSFRLRATTHVASNLFLEIDGEVIYLPGENRFGFRTVNGFGSPFLSLNYFTNWGEWDVRIYDDLGSWLPFDFRTGGDAIDWAGRYSFGFLGYENVRNGILFDPVIYNTVGIQASRLVSPEWRLTIEADHTDFFYVETLRDDEHRSLDHIGARIEAEPDTIPFSPYADYDAWIDSDSDRVSHTVYVGGGGRVSERVYVDGRFGYLWEEQEIMGQFSRDQWLWSVGVRHQIAERTSHGVYFGQDFFVNEFGGDSVVSDYVRYYLDHQFSDRLGFYGFAQWSHDDFRAGRFRDTSFDREVYGARLTYQLTERIRTDAGYRVETSDGTAGIGSLDRRIFDVNVDARVAERTNCYFRYQFEENDIFDEDLYVAGVRRYF